MKDYLVNAEIQTKASIRDPEGETILRDLILKSGFSSVKKLRTSKVIHMVVTAEDERRAEDEVRRICDELRIFNPLVSVCNIRVVGEDR